MNQFLRSELGLGLLVLVVVLVVSNQLVRLLGGLVLSSKIPPGFRVWWLGRLRGGRMGRGIVVVVVVGEGSSAKKVCWGVRGDNSAGWWDCR